MKTTFFSRLRNFIKHEKGWFLIPFFACVILGIAFCLSKRFFIWDEAYSYSLANDYQYGFVNFQTKGWYTHDLFNRFGVINSGFHYLQVVFNQSNDVHPPLYYLLLHTISSLFPNQISVWFGLGLNLIFYILSCCLIYYLCRTINPSKWLAPSVMLLYAANDRLIYSGLIYLRMYQLVSFFTILFIISVVKIIQSNQITKANKRLLFLTIIGGGLTHYYFYYVVCFTCLFLAIYFLVKKEYEILKSGVLIVVIAVVCNFCVFPWALRHIFVGQHGSYTLSHLSLFSFDADRFMTFVNFTWGKQIGLFLAIVVFAIGCFALFYKKEKKYLVPVILQAAYFLFLYTVSQTATYMNSHYVIPMECINLIATMSLLSMLIDNKKTVFIFPVVSLALGIKNSDFPGLIENLQTTPSWEFARDHKNDVALFVSDGTLLDGNIENVFLDIYEYPEIGFTSPDAPLENNLTDDFVLYVQEDMPSDLALSHVQQILPDGINITFEKQDNVVANGFDIYIANISQ